MITLPEHKKFVRHALLIALLTVILIGCEKRNDAELPSYEGNSIVVDAILTSAPKQQLVRIFKPVSQPNETPAAVSGANVLVSTPLSVYTFTEDLHQPGYYYSSEAFAGTPGASYSLLVNYAEQIYTAKAEMKPAGDFELLHYTRQADGTLYQIQWVANPYSACSPSMYEILLDWSQVAGYTSLAYEQTHARLSYYALPTLDVSQLFAPAAEKILFPEGTRITENRYALTENHAAFIRAMLLETTWQGGYFNTASANIPTNMSNNALGYFAACGIITKTTEVTDSGTAH